MSLLRRGFKTWCENAAKGYRREFGVGAHAALDPRLVASNMDVKIWTPADVPGLSTAALQQLTKDTENWSAVTICVAAQSRIIVNDQQTLQRQNNSLMHELSHIILKHTAAKVFLSPGRQMLLSEYDKVQEEEADCLSGTLLVPREALLSCLRGDDEQSVAAHFGVSLELLRMRINRTGVFKQLGRSRLG